MNVSKPPPPDRRPIIAVIGTSSADQPTISVAEEVGQAIGTRGWHLLCGGGAGVMEAACRGFVKARPKRGGMTIGILPTDEMSFANPFVEIPIPTGLGWARNTIIARAAWALIAVGGCSGTLSEIAFAWQMDRPIAAMTHAGGWAGKLAGKTVDDRRTEAIFAAKTVEEAIVYIKSKI